MTGMKNSIDRHLPIFLLTEETFQIRCHRLREKGSQDFCRRPIGKGNKMDLLRDLLVHINRGRDFDQRHTSRRSMNIGQMNASFVLPDSFVWGIGRFRGEFIVNSIRCINTVQFVV